MNFNTLALSPEILANLDTLGFEQMTPIQAMSLPKIIEGRDVIGQAKTGSGKTTAFGLGILSKLEVESLTTQALVLCPTRELADQVMGELRRLARATPNVKIVSLCGGTDEKHQRKSLDYGVHIIVGTPGRIFKLLRTKAISLSGLKSFVLDEADRMLDMGFAEDINQIADFTPKEKQTLLFSATFPETIKELSVHIQKDPEMVKVDVEHTESSIEKLFYKLKSHKDKSSAVVKLLAKYRPESTVVFCKTKLICDSLANDLNKQGIDAVSLHGDHDQRDRTLVLTKFSNGSARVLVATDVAARGLDIDDLSLVINFDLPRDAEIFTHRVGRTGRIGREGVAVSLFVEQEQYKIDKMFEVLRTSFEIFDGEDLEHAEGFSLLPEMKTLFISGGRKDKLRPGDIVGAIVGTSQVEASVVGDIKIMNVFTYVAVKREHADQVVKGLQAGKIKKRNFRVGYA